MKNTVIFSIFWFLLFSVQISLGQVQEKTNNSPGGNTGTKAQDHNSTRSNKSGIQAPDFGPNGKDSVAGKKGYQYYKAKSDISPQSSGTKAQDHNSTRSNKTANVVAPDNSSGGNNSLPNVQTTKKNSGESSQSGKSESGKK